MADTTVPDTSQASPLQPDVLGSMLAAGVNASGGIASTSPQASKAGGLSNLAQTIANTLSATQIMLDNVGKADTQLTQAKVANDVGTAGLQVSGAKDEATIATQQATNLQNLNAANVMASTVMGADVNDASSRIFQQMKLRNENVDKAEASLATYRDKNATTLGSVIFGDHTVGDLVNKVIHPASADLNYADASAKIAGVADSNIKDIQAQYDGTVRRNTAVANIVTNADIEAAARLKALPQLVAARTSLGNAYLSGINNINFMREVGLGQMQTVTEAARATTEVASSQHQMFMQNLAEARAARLEAQANRKDSAADDLQHTVDAVNAGRKLVGGIGPDGTPNLKPIPGPTIKLLARTTDGARTVQTYLDIGINAITDLDRKDAPPVNWVPSPGDAMLFASSNGGADTLAMSPGSQLLRRKLGELANTARAITPATGNKVDSDKMFVAKLNTSADQWLTGVKNSGSLDDPTIGQAPMHDTAVSKVWQDPSVTAFYKTIIAPLADKGYIPTALVAGSALASGLPDAVVAKGLAVYAQVAAVQNTLRVNPNRVGITMPAATASLPTQGVFKDSHQVFPMDEKTMINYVRSQRLRPGIPQAVDTPAYRQQQLNAR